MTHRYSFYYLLLFAIFLVDITVPVVSVAQEDENLLSKEYFIQQTADEDLLITINAFEAEFESRITGQNDEALLVSSVPGSRIIPLFQYVDAPKSLRQLDIEVSSYQHTARSEFGLELTRLKIWDDRSKAVSRAYRMLSYGMLSSRDASEANWTVKIDSLVNAGRLFQQFGMMEMRLWASYLSAHLIQFHLHDYSIVYSMTREILTELKGVRLQKIELATLQLQSAALIQLKRSGSLSIRANGPDPVQTSLSRTAALADAMGFHFEQAHALNLSGIEYAADLFPKQALGQFELAVKIAELVGDAELANSTRERIVDIHSLQGNQQASSEVLQKMETKLIEKGSGDELALNLLAQGRLSARSFNYQQAQDFFYQALNYQNDSAILRQVNFELARVFYQTGRLDESIAYMQLAQVSPGSGQQRRTNSLIDIGEGLRILANIYRTRGEYDAMRRARRAQGQNRPSKARYLYDQGLDELAISGKNGQRAQSFFRQGYQVATVTAQKDLQHLSRLQFCALGGGADSLCTKASVETSYQWLVGGGVPRFAIEAMFLRVQILILNRQRSEALTLMDRLVDEIHLLRYSLPGVLGAWYRERHEQLFEYYLDLLATPSSQRGRTDGLASLLVLSKIRSIEKHTGTDTVADNLFGNTDQLRTQLAQRENSEPGQDLSALKDNINRGLINLRKPFAKKFEHLSKAGLQSYLQSLKKNEAVLTYHISPTTVQVWIGQKGRVQRRNISNPAYIYAALQDSRQGLADIGGTSFNNKMDALGKRLITPIVDLLPETVYWIPAGSLLGFPFDALRVNNRYLVENHTVVNLVSFPANPSPGTGLQAGLPKTVFLAGHPRDYSGEYATSLDTSTEIRTVAEKFIGPGLTIVQGTALLPDEFETEQFQQAQLVHLSMPGIIDLKYPGQSSLELSGTEFSVGRVLLKPRDIQSKKLQANLVFLSATSVREAPLSGFSSQPGLISDFIDAGAQSVIARSWASKGGIGEAFIGDFYGKLRASGNIADSLANAKREYLKANRANGLYDWAGYQLYTN